MLPSKETSACESPYKLISVYLRSYASVEFKGFGAWCWAAFPFIQVVTQRMEAAILKKHCVVQKKEMYQNLTRSGRVVSICASIFKKALSFSRCTNCEAGIHFEVITNQHESSFLTQNLRETQFQEILNRVFKYYMFQDKHFAWDRLRGRNEKDTSKFTSQNITEKWSWRWRKEEWAEGGEVGNGEKENQNLKLQHLGAWEGVLWRAHFKS